MQAVSILTILLLIVCFAGATLVYIGCDADDDDDDDDDNADDGEDGTDDEPHDTGDVWTDPTTGLMWQVSTSYGYDWYDADEYCKDTTLGGYSNWRLPTISELRSLIRGCEDTITGGACGVTDSCLYYNCLDDLCRGCPYLEGPDLEGPVDAGYGAYWPREITGSMDWAWSASSVADMTDNAWRVHFGSAEVGDIGKGSNDMYVRCVR